MMHRRTFVTSAIAGTVLALKFPLPTQAAPARGPRGESALPARSLALTPEQAVTVRAGGFTTALVWHESSDWCSAVNQGARDEFARLGVAVVAQTDANFDAAKQKSDVETVMAKKPSVIFAQAVDPDTASEAFKSARNAATLLVFVDQPPVGHVHGKDYVAVVSADLTQMGKRAADAMSAALGGKGQIAYLYHDASFFVTNQRDRGFRQSILSGHKGIRIVAEQGLADPARAQDIAGALISRHPRLDGIYVSWASPAESVLAALRNAGKRHTKIVTMDLSEPLALDMARSGNVAAIICDEAYQIGVTGARAAALGLIGHQVAPYLVVDAITVTRDTLRAGYRNSLQRDLPPSLNHV